jgi:Glu-tRNA(Gln) amidotransferase subunit E-like FAD-binding protein
MTMRAAVTGVFSREELTLYGLVESAARRLTRALNPTDDDGFNRLLVAAQDEVVLGDLYQLLTEAKRALAAVPTANAVKIVDGVVSGAIHTGKLAVE